MLIDELLTYLFDAQTHLLTAPMATWLTSSRRFATFVDTFRDKIRKKLRTMQDEERLQDLRLELETAYLLLQEKSLSILYEPQYGKVRGPDFEVAFTTSLTFMVEVTRIRTGQPQGQGEPLQLAMERLADAMCTKLGQLLPKQSNILIIGVEPPYPKRSDLQAAMLRVQQRAERNESAFLQRYRFRDRAEFFRYYLRLSEMIVRPSHWETDDPAVIWVNAQAKHPLPSKVRTALYRSHKLYNSAMNQWR
jgi:hypothetical protein